MSVPLCLLPFCPVTHISSGVDECMLDLCFRFLSVLEDEVYSSNSPIWNPEFMQTYVPGEAGAGNAAVDLPTCHVMCANVRVGFR